MSKCKYETKNGRCGLKGSYAYRHKCFTEDLCKCHEPMTNADRIRAMTDEELVEYFWKIGVWDSFDDRKFCDSKCNAEQNCDLCRLKWLQQPAEGDA